MHNSNSQNNGYDKDFYKWALTQVNFLKKGEFEKVDFEHVIEEIESLGISQRSALKSQMIRLLMHLLKINYQPEKHTKSWDRSVIDARIKIETNLEYNPSLRREIKKFIEEAYPHAVKKAQVETNLPLKKFPKECPWTVKEILESDD